MVGVVCEKCLISSICRSCITLIFEINFVGKNIVEDVAKTVVALIYLAGFMLFI